MTVIIQFTTLVYNPAKNTVYYHHKNMVLANYAAGTNQCTRGICDLHPPVITRAGSQDAYAVCATGCSYQPHRMG
jgi:hypothetical protein